MWYVNLHILKYLHIITNVLVDFEKVQWQKNDMNSHQSSTFVYILIFKIQQIYKNMLFIGNFYFKTVDLFKS